MQAQSQPKQGCLNRSFKDTVLVQDGYQDLVVSPAGADHQKIRVAVYKEIPFVMSKDCHFDARSTDAKCQGCKHQ